MASTEIVTIKTLENEELQVPLQTALKMQFFKKRYDAEYCLRKGTPIACFIPADPLLLDRVIHFIESGEFNTEDDEDAEHLLQCADLAGVPDLAQKLDALLSNDLPMTEYTLAEVQKKAKENKIWVVCDNVVYDVTSYINKHPGGARCFTQNNGGDITMPFLTFHRGNRAARILRKFRVGVLAKKDRKNTLVPQHSMAIGGGPGMRGGHPVLEAIRKVSAPPS
eukprot:GCRY01001193.1.p1 GENE.GCRY01001193.1~~GCRY01001193.1.p1  ORF type:complete len:223 (+),score=31.28 GCRY01001193.1:255-923(+)